MSYTAVAADNRSFIAEIEKLIDEKIRPDLLLHGGNICLIGLKDDILSVRLTGQCSNCPSARLTMENIVEKELKEAFPQLKDVELAAGVSDDLIEEAWKMIRARSQNVNRSFN